MTLLYWYILLLALDVVLIFAAAAHIRAFLARNPAITDIQGLDSFKRMVRLQMYGALVGIVLLVGSGLIGIYGIVTSQISLLLVILLNGGIFGLAYLAKFIEKHAKSLKVDLALAKEYASAEPS